MSDFINGLYQLKANFHGLFPPLCTRKTFDMRNKIVLLLQKLSGFSLIRLNFVRGAQPLSMNGERLAWKLEERRNKAAVLILTMSVLILRTRNHCSEHQARAFPTIENAHNCAGISLGISQNDDSFD